jgi:hypothetical protein
MRRVTIGGTARMAIRMTEDQLRRAHQVLSDLLGESDQQRAGDGEPAWYEPPAPPVAFGANLSATDLLSWWFRPPSKKRRDAWDTYFGEPPTSAATSGAAGASAAGASAAAKQDTPPSVESEILSSAVWQALVPETETPLTAEDADSATEVLYAFLHAFGRRDIDSALQWIADDYHAIENDQEIDRNGLRCRLESLLDSLYGWDIEVSLAAPPEPLVHPYGILIYAEIQIDGRKPSEMAVRSQLERRLALLQRAGESGWKIAALSQPRV